MTTTNAKVMEPTWTAVKLGGFITYRGWPKDNDGRGPSLFTTEERIAMTSILKGKKRYVPCKQGDTYHLLEVTPLNANRDIISYQIVDMEFSGDTNLELPGCRVPFPITPGTTYEDVDGAQLEKIENNAWTIYHTEPAYHHQQEAHFKAIVYSQFADYTEYRNCPPEITTTANLLRWLRDAKRCHMMDFRDAVYAKGIELMRKLDLGHFHKNAHDSFLFDVFGDAMDAVIEAYRADDEKLKILADHLQYEVGQIKQYLDNTPSIKTRLEKANDAQNDR